MAAVGVTLARTFQDLQSPLYWGTIGGCCITPPVGHVLTHDRGPRERAAPSTQRPAEKTLHHSRWWEPWCLGGTRPLAGQQEAGLRRLVGMAMPNERVVYGTEPLNAAELREELRWRTAIAEEVARALGPLDPAEGTAEERAALGGSAANSGASAMAMLVFGKQYRLPANWRSSSLRRQCKQLVCHLKQLGTSALPVGRLRATPPGHLADAFLTILTLPNRIAPAEDMDQSFFLRSYVLPREPVSELAFRLSMEEGRQGRPMADSDAALQAPWANPSRCSQLIKKYLEEGA